MNCAYCGAEDFDEYELNDDDKCQECVVEDCNHRSTWKEYIASGNQNARFHEFCIGCKSWRIIHIRFEQGIDIREWRSGDVE